MLYLGRFGTNARTDGFFVAFALYSTFGVFSQSLRLTSVGLLVEPGARLSARQFAAVLGVVARWCWSLTVPGAGALAGLIAPGLKAGARQVTATALPVLGVAMVLAAMGRGGATVLAIRGRFGTIAGGYTVGAAGGLMTFLVLMGHTGVQTLGWSMGAMSVLTCTWMLVGMRRSGGWGAWPAELAARPVEPFGSAAVDARRRARAPIAWRGACAAGGDCGVVLGRTAIYLAFNLLFVITLAFASRSAAGEHDGALLCVPVRELPGGGYGDGAGDVEHPRYDPPGARAARGARREHGAARVSLRDADGGAGAGGADRERAPR